MTWKGFIYFLFILSFFSCKKENAGDCFKSNGDEVSEVRSAGKFSRLEMFDNIEVTLVKGPEYKVEVTAGEHIIKNIATEVSEGTLTIENRNKCNFVRGYKKQMKVKVFVPSIRQVFSNGVGILKFDEAFEQDTIHVKAESSGDVYIKGRFTSLNVISSGNADFYMSGSTADLSVFTSGTNYIRAESMSASDLIFVESLSIGDCFVDARTVKKLQYKIWGEGSIYYKGEPSTIEGYYDKDSKGKAVRQD